MEIFSVLFNKFQFQFHVISVKPFSLQRQCLQSKKNFLLHVENRIFFPLYVHNLRRTCIFTSLVRPKFRKKSTNKTNCSLKNSLGQISSNIMIPFGLYSPLSIRNPQNRNKLLKLSHS